MFLLKKLIAPLFLPLSLGLGLLAAGLAALWLTRRRGAGRLLVTAGTVVIAAFSYDAPAAWLLRPLERRYPPLLGPRDLPGKGASIRWIVVLGGGHTPDPSLPVTSRLSDASLVRAVEAIRLQRLMPRARLLFSGGEVFASSSEARSMAALARALGVAEGDIALEEGSRDTKDQARLVGSITGRAPFILVTSAFHMPRAMALFRSQGLRPIPAPTGHHIRSDPLFGSVDLYPRASALRKTERALHEYLGLAWAWLRGQADFRPAPSS